MDKTKERHELDRLLALNPDELRERAKRIAVQTMMADVAEPGEKQTQDLLTLAAFAATYRKLPDWMLAEHILAVLHVAYHMK